LLHLEYATVSGVCSAGNLLEGRLPDEVSRCSEAFAKYKGIYSVLPPRCGNGKAKCANAMSLLF